MNQILNIDNSKDFIEVYNKHYSSKRSKFKLQFLISIILIFLIIMWYFINIYFKNSKELTAHKITNNYNIEKLYNNNDFTSKVYSQGSQLFTVIGMIEIPKINVYYPIISEANDELLKISPCRISGPMPNENGNLCIAGHNYDNYKFFSKLSTLKNNDTIFIYDINGNKELYTVYKIYEVTSNDLSPLDLTKDIKKEVTLVTCNNFNSDSRIIIKAYSNLEQKDHF